MESSSTGNVGTGVKMKCVGLPTHNPMPTTERGQRRHEKRNADQRKHAEAAWRKDRSIKPTRYDKNAFTQ